MMAEDPSSTENQTQLLDNDSKNYDALTSPKVRISFLSSRYLTAQSFT